jgi:hypothetical protein
MEQSMTIPLQVLPVQRCILQQCIMPRSSTQGQPTIVDGDDPAEKGIAASDAGVVPSYAGPDPLCGPFGLCIPHVHPWVQGRG